MRKAATMDRPMIPAHAGGKSSSQSGRVAVSGITSPTPSASGARPRVVLIAVVLSVLVLISNLITPMLPRGSGDNRVPAFALILSIIFGVAGIAAAIGLWLLRRWGYILILIVTALNLIAM